MSQGVPKDYNIFNDFETLETIRTEMEKEYEKADNSTFCDNIKCQTNKLEQIKKICKLFVSLYNTSKSECRNNPTNPECRNYPEFMNFWLNYKLNEAGYSETEQKQFYNEMTRNYHQFIKNDILKVKLYVIVEKYFNNMSILYKLYKMLFSPLEEKYIECDNFMEKFKDTYNEGLKKCYLHCDINLGKELEKFKNIYKQKGLNNVKSCTGENINSLPELSLVYTTDKPKLRTSNIASELLQKNYQNLVDRLPKIEDNNYNDLKNLISVHYNLLFEYKEEKQNCLMIRILHQFFQYCNDYKYNRKLSIFMKEFINEYYTKHKKEYEKIFEECKDTTSSKEYCKLYNTCKEKFETNLSLIEGNSIMYIEQQEKYIKNLLPLGFLILEAQAIFKDFDAMSKYSTTIISIMILFFLCSFFLYKLTPLSSIFRKEKKRKKIPLFYPEIRTQEVSNNNSRRENIKPKRGKIRFAYHPS